MAEVLQERDRELGNDPEGHPLIVVDEELASLSAIRELKELGPPMFKRRFERSIIMREDDARPITGLDQRVVCLFRRDPDGNGERL